MFYKIIRGLAVVLWRLYFNIKCVGEENIPESGGYILAANHQTMNDPVFAAEKVKRQMYFMAKAELFENGFLRWFFNQLGAFPIQRGKFSLCSQKEPAQKTERLCGPNREWRSSPIRPRRASCPAGLSLWEERRIFAAR